MQITHEGLVAGVRFLQMHCDGFDDGTGDHFHTPFIRDLLLEVCRASNIALDMPEVQPHKPHTNASAGHQEKLWLLAFLPGPDGEGSPVLVDCHRIS